MRETMLHLRKTFPNHLLVEAKINEKLPVSMFIQNPLLPYVIEAELGEKTVTYRLIKINHQPNTSRTTDRTEVKNSL